jgi:histone H3/H4
MSTLDGRRAVDLGEFPTNGHLWASTAHSYGPDYFDREAQEMPTENEALLVTQSHVKRLINEHGCHAGKDACDGLDTLVRVLVAQACERAKANGRKTVRDHDFVARSSTDETQP